MSRAELRVALDIGSKKHHVAIRTADGCLLDEFELAHEKAGFARFFSRVETLRERLDLPVMVAMEGLGGWARPLDRMIQQRGFELLNVNNVKLARFKEIFAAPAKTDKIDTRKILELIHMREALPLAKRVLHRVGVTPIANEQLKRFTRRRGKLVDEKTRVSNRLVSKARRVRRSPGSPPRNSASAVLFHSRCCEARSARAKSKISSIVSSTVSLLDAVGVAHRQCETRLHRIRRRRGEQNRRPLELARHARRLRRREHLPRHPRYARAPRHTRADACTF